MIDNQKQLRAKLRWGVVGIIALLILSALYIAPQYTNKAIASINKVTALGIPPITSTFKLGLDLQGGAQLIYDANVSAIPEADREDAVAGVRDAIERRVNGTGIGESSIQTSQVGDQYRLNVDLPGIENIADAITLIGETPILEFKETNTEPPRDLTPAEEAQLAAENKEAKARSQELLQARKNGTDFAELVAEYSEDSSTKNNGGYIGFLPQNSIAPLYDWAADHKEGDVSDTIIETDLGYHILSRGGEREGKLQFQTSHILICYLGAQDCTQTRSKEEAKQLAQSLFDQANADNFAALAEEQSDDAQTSINGGELGWFQSGGLVPAFEEAVLAANVGEIIGPVETPYGFHVIYKTDEDAGREYELSHVLIAKHTEADILPPYSAWKTTGLSGKQLERAEVVTDPTTGMLHISLRFDKEGAQLFEDLTRNNIGQPIAIFLDGSIISQPTVQQAISGGEAVITGTFTLPEAKLLAQRLNTGALPIPIELVSQHTVGATLGALSLSKSVQAGIIGIVILMLFMVAYYRLPGVLSVISLLLYIALTLAIFKFIGVTLTLAGIAGLILSVGMAIDANVLIFERLKEELRAGKNLRIASEEGFVRAWTSIRDGNVSTLITCAILIWFGTSFVQGFALTLAIGICVSMFCAITVTRALLRFIIPWFPRYGNALFLGARKEVPTQTE